MSGGARVLILGGGYVGIDAYRSILRRAGGAVRRGEIRITVVNPTPFHTFHGFTGEVLGGLLGLEHTLTPLGPLLPRARLVEGTATRADLDAQTVEVALAAGGTCTLGYDHLLLGTGSRDPFERLPGLREFGWRLKDSRDMQAFRTRLEERFRSRQPTTFAVIGGGFAGVEMAAALQERLRREALPGRVHLLSSGGVLDGLSERFPGLAQHAQRSLERAGVRLHLGARATELRPGGVRLKGGPLIHADEVLFAAGISLSVLPGTEALPRDASGRLLADEFLRVRSQAAVWTGGDAAVVRRPGAPDSCPANALWAMKHGMWAGSNIALSVRGRPLKRFSYRGLGQAASLGLGNGVAELLGVPLTGWAAWALRLGFFTWYMPSKAHGARVLRDLLRLPFRAPPEVGPLPVAAD
ncbi:NAD(P)/FAD-dependent oxidoreductase [Deinococcus koreensis]|uniref:FAD/NAD(P)-binding domain-containing protein n=1 Tax=Deinococcus koreensis TaxID=2054903 RepID=A0A2K3V0K3_9DEIO|nr:FAD-dependent oxidoreductase [Deinococcus koreensis]PNY82310.1 hypothetical protein CVO96_13915 [Deinococcus koreensis]